MSKRSGSRRVGLGSGGRLCAASAFGLGLLLVASCSDDDGPAEEATATSSPASVVSSSSSTTTLAVPVTSYPSVSSTSTTTVTPATSAGPTGALSATDPPLDEFEGSLVDPGVPDCTMVDAILDLLWNERERGESPDAVFTLFSGEDPNGELTVEAFDTTRRLLAGRLMFGLDRIGDGIARGVVWVDGLFVGHVYYLENGEQIAQGEVALLDYDGAAGFITVELATDETGQAVAVGCWHGSKPPLVSYDDLLTINGIGPIELDMTLDEVMDEIGDFELFGLDGQQILYGGACYDVWIEDSGLALVLDGLGAEASPLHATVAAVRVMWSPYSATSGIGILSSRADIEAALGDQLVESEGPGEGETALDFVPKGPDEQDLRLRFELGPDHTVNGMVAGYERVTSRANPCP